MSASAGCGTCAGLAFGQGSMNEGVDVNGDVEVCVVRLRGREDVAVNGWWNRFGSERVRGRVRGGAGREWVVQSLHRVRMIRKEVVWVVLQGVGTLMVV